MAQDVRIPEVGSDEWLSTVAHKAAEHNVITPSAARAHFYAHTEPHSDENSDPYFGGSGPRW